MTLINHGALITTYKDFNMLKYLVEKLINDKFNVYIHIDKNSKITKGEEDNLRNLGCYVERKYKVYWGSNTHLEAILNLMARAVLNTQIDYLHVISGQDYPVGSISTKYKLFDGSIYMDIVEMSAVQEDVQDRLKFYNLLFPIERFRNIPRPIDSLSRIIQNKIGINRKKSGIMGDVYKGLVWMSIPRDVAYYITTDKKVRMWRLEVKSTYIPEEFFFQTAILHSPFRSMIVNDSLRYMDWDSRDGIRPSILDERDFEDILSSKALFARKMDSSKSKCLMSKLDNII